MKKLINKVAKSHENISRSREKVQNYLANMINTPKKKSARQSRHIEENRLARSRDVKLSKEKKRSPVGQIVNQTQNLSEYFRHKSEEN